MSYVRSVRLRVPSCVARPGPAIGQALGPLGINMAEFCKQFNARTELIYTKDNPLTVHLHAMNDRSFTFDVMSPPTSHLLKKAAGVTKGMDSPNIAEDVGGYCVTPEMIYEIAKMKMRDEKSTHLNLEGVAKSVIGTARSMGIRVKEATEAEE
mmetsp:Transcript_15955/g.18885  ORF Transcript_15955/g.18885 Transcript_15955/m.18885 type:complete len:153 (+) Transcript_15955:130-588(+)